MSMVLWSLGEFCAQGLKDEDGALELGWVLFVQGVVDEDGAWVNLVRPRDNG